MADIPDAPITREETFLASIAGQDVVLPEPVTRVDLYLSKIAGQDTGIPEEPITRIEQYLAYIAENGSQGGGEITVEPLSVSANGTYEAKAGSSYNPVVVDVQGGGGTEAEAVLASILSDYSELDHIAKAAFPVAEASGSVASFSDGADGVPVQDLTVQIEPVQAGSGDPSPENVRPITGWTGAKVTRTGKNLFDKDNYSGIERGYINTLDSTISLSSARLTVYIPCKPNTTYTASRNRLRTNERLYISYTSELPAVGVTVGKASGAAYSGNIGEKMSVTVTTDASAKYLVVWVYWHDDDKTQALNELQIELGSTATAYEPYAGDTYDIAFGEAGTVYGGTLDVVTGVLTVTNKTLTLDGTENWNTYDLAPHRFANLTLFSDALPPIENGQVIRSSHFTRQNPVTPMNGKSGDCFLSARNFTSSYKAFVVWLDTANTSTEFQQYLIEQAQNGTPVQITYELAMPRTYQLTPQQITTLLSTNNIWADCGDVAVTYRADPTRYADKRLGAVKAILAGVEAGYTATRNYSTGDFLIVGDAMYRATAAIANGGTITPGTNVAETTVAEQLAALFAAINS